MRRSRIATDAPFGRPRSGPKTPIHATARKAANVITKRTEPAAGGGIDERQDEGERNDATRRG